MEPCLDRIDRLGVCRKEDEEAERETPAEEDAPAEGVGASLSIVRGNVEAVVVMPRSFASVLGQVGQNTLFSDICRLEAVLFAVRCAAATQAMMRKV